MLHPMHSRTSPRRPSEILRGRNGSAIPGRAMPTRSIDAAADGGRHRVRADEPADGHDRLAGGCAHLRDVLELVALVEEARGPRGIAPLVPSSGR